MKKLSVISVIFSLLFILSCEDKKDTTPPEILDILSVEYDLEKMTVKWNQSQDGDFKQYNLYYSESENGTKTLVKTITSKTITSFVTTTFNPKKENWYFLEVVDTSELKTMGRGKTNSIESPPIKPILNPIFYDIKNKSLQISWSRNNENDFKTYEVFESDYQGFSTSKSVNKDTESSNTSINYSLNYDQKKYFKIVTTDYWDLESESNIKIGSSYQRIIYQYFKDSDNRNINMTDINGDTKFELTTNGSSSYSDVSNINIGKIVYVLSNNNRNDIYVMDKDGTNKTLLTGSFGQSNLHPIFINDPLSTTQKIIWISYDGTNQNIYSMELDGTNKLNLTNLSGLYGIDEFDTSDDGSKIIYTRGRGVTNTGNPRIYIMDRDGTNNTNLTIMDRPYNYRSPDISPDGQKIVYVSDEDDYGSGKLDVYLMNIDGSNKIRLTNSKSCLHPIFNSNGDKIYYYNSDNLYSMNLDGTSNTNLTNNGNIFTNYKPSISSDGQYISLTLRLNGDDKIYVLNISTGQLNEVVNGFFPIFEPRN